MPPLYGAFDVFYNELLTKRRVGNDAPSLYKEKKMEQQNVVTNLAARLAERVRAARGSEIAINTLELQNFIEEGERQLAGLFEKIKVSDREILYLKDRIQGQSDTISRLQKVVQESQLKKRK